MSQSGAACSLSAAPLLEVRDLEVRFRIGDDWLRAVDRVSFDLQRGETLALVGESGCGKSTLARAVAGLVPSRSGSIRLAGVELSGLTRRQWRPHRRRVQMVFQDPDASLNPRMTAGALIAEPVRLHRGLRGVALDERVCVLMERVGLDPGLRNRHPHAFSGGQRQRIGIARALAVEPDLLLCDEVTSALDVSIQAQILDLLAGLQGDLGLTMLFITHDLGVVRHVAHRVAVMYLGQLVETATAASLFATPLHPYTRKLLDAVPRMNARAGLRSGGDAAAVRHVAAEARIDEIASPLDPPSGCRFHPRCPLAFDRCRREAPEMVVTGHGAARCFLASGSGDPPTG